MRNRLVSSLPLSLSLAALALAGTEAARADDPPPPASATTSTPAADSQGNGASLADPHKQALLKEVQRYATPDQHHEVLKMLVGKWTTTAKHYSEGGSKPERVTGHDQTEVILDGRFVEDHYDSIIWGNRYSGQGTLGYDLREQQYVLSWVDNWGSWITVAKGNADATNHIITLSTRDYDNPAGKTRPTRYIITIDDNDKHSRRVYEKVDGKETLTMEIEYRRAK